MRKTLTEIFKWQRGIKTQLRTHGDAWQGMLSSQCGHHTIGRDRLQIEESFGGNWFWVGNAILFLFWCPPPPPLLPIHATTHLKICRCRWLTYTTAMKRPYCTFMHHQSIAGHTKETPTRTSVKLSSANWDIKATMLWEDWFPWSLCCLSVTLSSVSVSLEGSGMLLTFSWCIRRSACGRGIQEPV